MSTVERAGPPPTQDLGRLLGLSGPGAWTVAVLFGIVWTTIAALSGGAGMRTVEGWVALALTLVAAALLVLPWRYPLPLPVVLFVLAIVVFTTVTIIWRLPTAGWPGWSSWNFGADSMLLYMVALRGRVEWGALGMLLIVALTVHWTVATSDDWRRGIDLTYTQVFSFCAVAFFALWLRRTARGIAEFRDVERRRIAAEAAQSSAAAERRAHLDRVRQDAGPALTRIADGDTTAAERREHGLLEAELRDRIRGRALASGDLPAALRAARTRGVEVALLDDLRDEAPPESELRGATAWAAQQLASVSSGDATIRLARVDGAPVVTFAISTGRTLTYAPTPAAPDEPTDRG